MSHARHTPVAIALALSLLLGGCGDEAEAGQVVTASVPRAKATADDAAAGAAAAGHVATTLYAPFAAEAGDGNLAFSPTSITMALGMTRAGAQGTSADQLDALLATDPSRLHAALNGLDATLGSRAGERKNDAGEKVDIELAAANSLWGQRDVEWQTPFLETLNRNYGVGVHVVDYIGQSEQARTAINDWVADRTHDHIVDLIAEGVIEPITRLSLVNALYLAAPWADRFSEAADETFTTAGGTEVQAPMLNNSAELRYQRGTDWQAVSIPYAGGELAMTLLVPDAGKLSEVEDHLDDALLDQVLTGGEPTVLTLTMPSFDLASRPGLTAALERVGVTEPFETGGDFLPMTTDPGAQPLRLADAIHMATVTVDKEGTVAAAATAMVFETVGGMVTDTELKVDRPFLFVIHDLETATPLFLGRVTDPTAP